MMDDTGEFGKMVEVDLGESGTIRSDLLGDSGSYVKLTDEELNSLIEQYLANIQNNKDEKYTNTKKTIYDKICNKQDPTIIATILNKNNENETNLRESNNSNELFKKIVTMDGFNDKEKELINFINSYIRNNQDNVVKYTKIFNSIKSSDLEVKSVIHRYIMILLNFVALNKCLMMKKLIETINYVLSKIGNCDDSFLAKWTPRVIKRTFGNFIGKNSNSDELEHETKRIQTTQTERTNRDFAIPFTQKSAENSIFNEALVQLKIGLINLTRNKFVELYNIYIDDNDYKKVNTITNIGLDSFYLNTVTQTITNILAVTIITLAAITATVTNPLSAFVIPVVAFAVSMRTKNTFLVKDPNDLLLNRQILENFVEIKKQLKTKIGFEQKYEKCNSFTENEIEYFNKFALSLKKITNFEKDYKSFIDYEKELVYYMNLSDILNTQIEVPVAAANAFADIIFLEPDAASAEAKRLSSKNTGTYDAPQNARLSMGKNWWLTQQKNTLKIVGTGYKDKYRNHDDFLKPNFEPYKKYWVETILPMTKFLFLDESDKILLDKNVNEEFVKAKNGNNDLFKNQLIDFSSALKQYIIDYRDKIDIGVFNNLGNYTCEPEDADIIWGKLSKINFQNFSRDFVSNIRNFNISKLIPILCDRKPPLKELTTSTYNPLQQSNMGGTRKNKHHSKRKYKRQRKGTMHRRKGTRHRRNGTRHRRK